MDFVPYVDKEVLVQFAPGFGYVLPLAAGGDKIAPAIVGQVGKERMPLQLPFLVGIVRKEKDSERFFLEFKNGLEEQDPTQKNQRFKVEFGPSIIVAITVVGDRPMLVSVTGGIR